MNSKVVLKAIKRNRVFLIATHMNPDIDGLASELAVALYLKSLKKKVSLVNADKVLAMYRFLPGIHLIKEFRGQSLDYDVAVILDCADFDRIGAVKKIIKKDKMLVNIDHHVTNNFFGDVNTVNTQASSTTEVIFDLLKDAKYRLSRPIALLLYLGIMTDTGSFRYDNTTSRTHWIVSQLMKFKFSVNQLYNRIYEIVPFHELKIFTRLINNFQMTHRGRVASIELPKTLLSRFSGEFDLREKIFTFLRAIKGVEVIIILTEGEKNSTRINFRSQGKVDVAKLASFYNGGGHKKASGCWVKGNLKKAKEEIFSRLNRVLR